MIRPVKTRKVLYGLKILKSAKKSGWTSRRIRVWFDVPLDSRKKAIELFDIWMEEQHITYITYFPKEEVLHFNKIKKGIDNSIK